MRKVILAAVATMSLGMLTACTDEFKEACVAQNGFIKSDTVWHVSPAIDPATGNVSMAVTATTVRYCFVGNDLKDVEVS